MGIAILLAYIALNLLSAGDMLPDLAPLRPALVLALMSLPLAILSRLQRPELGKLRVQFTLAILFYGWALASLIPHGGLGANLRTLAELSPNVIVYFVGLFLLDSPSKLSALRATLSFVAIVVLIQAFAGMSFARQTGVTTPYDLAGAVAGVVPVQFDVRIRGLGLMNDPNVFGQFLLIILPMLYVRKKDSGRGVGAILAILITILFVIGVYYTGSRGAEMGVVALLGLALIRRSKVMGIASGVFGSAILIAVNLRASHARTINLSGGMDRVAIWSDGMSYFKSSPIWGIGYGNFTYRQGMTAHNSFLLCAAELGFVGFFLWMSLIVVTILQLNRVNKLLEKTNPIMAQWARALRLSLGAYLFTAFFLSLTYELPLFLLLGMAGAVIAAAGGDESVPLRGTAWPVRSGALCVASLAVIYALLRVRVL